MMTRLLHLLVSSLVLCMYVCGSALNTACAVALLRFTKYADNNSGLLLIISLCVSDCISSLPLAVGCLEALVGVRIHPLSSYVIGALNHLSYCCCSLTLVLMAANRFVAIVFPMKFKAIFTPTNTKIVLGVVWAIAVCIPIAHLFICCPVVWNTEYVISTYQDTDVELNWMATADKVLSGSTMIAGIVFYLLTGVKIFRSRLSSLDTRLCYQFLAIICCYALLQVAWYVIPEHAEQKPELFYLIAVVIAINFTFNPYIYLMMNPTVCNAVRRLFGWNDETTTTSATHLRRSPMMTVSEEPAATRELVDFPLSLSFYGESFQEGDVML